MRLPIRKKVLLLTLALSAALIAASVLISSALFSRRIQNQAKALCREASESMVERIEETYLEFLSKYREQMDPIFRENREEILRVCASKTISYEEKEEFFYQLTLPLFPPRDSFGMTYEKAVFRGDYQSLLINLNAAASAAGMEGGYVFFCDEESGDIVYLLDSTADTSYDYQFPGSVDTETVELRKYVLDAADPQPYIINHFCFYAAPIRLNEADTAPIAYVGFQHSLSELEQNQQSFRQTIFFILLGATAVLALVYFLFADRFIVRNIRRLSDATETFSRQLQGDSDLKLIRSEIRSRDEVGELSSQFNLMQEKIVSYIQTLGEKTAQEESMRAELDIASRIQMQSLPVSGFETGSFRVNSYLKPAREVGGDLYDYFLPDEDHLFFTIADVSGKGIPAALFMMRGKELIKASAGKGMSPGEIAFIVNNELCRNNEAGLFITAFFGICDLHSGHLVYARAGHEQPFLIRDGKSEQISPESNIVLGLFEGFRYEEDSLDLKPGDRLVLFTDGVNEGINPAREEFGYERIRTVIEKQEGNVLPVLEESLTRFADGEEQFDDITLLQLSRAKEFELHFAHPDYSVISRACEESKMRLTGFPEERVSEVCIILDEVLNNIISYGGDGGDAPDITLSFRLLEDKITLRIEDTGIPFDPLQSEGPDLEKNILERPIGGLGIFFVRSMSDEVHYKREGNKNILTVTKTMKE